MNIKICFVVETTFKMTPYLYDVQCSMEETINTVRFYNPQARILISAVTYRDYKDCEQLTSWTWTPMEEFWDSWEDLQKTSRTAWFSENDTADVAGAVNCALEQDWSDASLRMLVHYGISPAHGSQFHGPAVDDRFPDGDPMGKDLLADVRTFSLMPCEYTFFRITPLVDTMLSLMDEVYIGSGKFTVNDLDATETYISEPDSEEE